MMKKSSLLFLLLFAFACTKPEIPESSARKVSQLCEGSIPHTFFIPSDSSISIQFPTCYRLELLQGIDSYVGHFISSEVSTEVIYDIGIPAGNYVLENSPNKQIFQSVDEEFWYEKKGDYHYFTFPNAGPANFYFKGDDYFDSFLEIMKTLQTN